MSDKAAKGQTSGPIRMQLSLLARGLGVLKPNLAALFQTQLADLATFWGVPAQPSAEALRRHVSLRLVKHFEQSSEPKILKNTRSYRSVFEYAFNVAEETSKLTFEARLGKAPVSLSTARRYFNTICREVERQILATGYVPTVPVPEQKAVRASNQRPKGTPNRSSCQATTIQKLLIDRTVEQDKIVQLVSEGHQVIWLCGEPGTGKSVLAGLIAARLAGQSPVARIRLGVEKVVERDIAAALLAEQVAMGDMPGSAMQVLFQERLQTPQFIGAVILDDASSGDEAWQFVPERPGLPIIITSRYRPSDERSKVYELGEFSREEAEKFVVQMLPAIAKEEAGELVSVLGHRPLALDLAVRFMKRSKMVSVGDLTALLLENVAVALDLIELPKPQQPKIIRLYEVILERILESDVITDALDAFLSTTGMTALALPELWYFAFCTIRPDGKNKLLQLDAAADQLSEYGLLREDGDYITMHPLTWRIMRELRAPSRRERDEKVLGALCETSAIQKHHADDLQGNAQSIPAALHRALRVITDRQAGWYVLMCIDLRTWTALRYDASDGACKPELYHVTYEIYPDRIYCRNTVDGHGHSIEKVEARELFRLSRLYQYYMHMCHAYDIDPSSDEEDFALTIERERLRRARGNPTLLRYAIQMAEVWRTMTYDPVFMPQISALREDAERQLRALEPESDE